MSTKKAKAKPRISKLGVRVWFRGKGKPTLREDVIGDNWSVEYAGKLVQVFDDGCVSVQGVRPMSDEKSWPKLSRPQCTEPCEFQSDWTCWHDGSINIEDRKCISFKEKVKDGGA